jgi:hypothetical protein
MKKIFLALYCGFITITVQCNWCYAQNSVQPVAFNNIRAFKQSVRNITALDSPTLTGVYVSDEKKINTKVIKDFQTRYADINNAQWYSTASGFVSYFTRDGFVDHVFYDKKGHWKYSFIFYKEDKFRRALRTVVKSTYFDMAISLVEEVQTANQKVYIVYLEDKSSIKILKVNDEGAYEILQDLNKG